MKRIFLTVLVFSFFISVYPQQQAAITSGEVLDHIEYLASDSLKGRKPGTPESVLAAEYIRNQFKAAGLVLLGDEGMQYFELVTDVELGDGNSFSVNGINGILNDDFVPLPFTENSHVSESAVFVGYGFDINNDSVQWNDYEGMDLNGRWAIIMRGSPDAENPTGKFSGNVAERIKVMVAKDKGAAGVIFVSGEQFDEADKLLKLSYDKSAARAGIPVVNVKRNLVDTVFSAFGLSVAKAETRIMQTRSPYCFTVPAVFDIETDVLLKKERAQNVVAMLKGSDPVLADQYIIIGAHYDHLGMGGPGSGSRMPDTVAVHYGADDNASGVAGVIELAEKLASEKGSIGRSIVFMAFDAEEMGLVGSKYFAEYPLVELDEVTAMINFDMIGRLKPAKTVAIGGTGTSEESEDLLNKLAKNSGLELKFSPEGFGPSDHAAFYNKDIPVFFISTGAHGDYHTPDDNVEAINAKGEVAVIKFTEKLVKDLASRDEMLTFKEAGPKTRARHGYNFKVTFGIMPDFTGTDNDGLRVDAVRGDGPAFAGGMEKGDKIVAIDGKPVGNIYDYMGRLKNLEAGQIVTVDVIRKGKVEVLLIPL
jgi:hypothetical protein